MGSGGRFLGPVAAGRDLGVELGPQVVELGLGVSGRPGSHLLDMLGGLPPSLADELLALPGRRLDLGLDRVLGGLLGFGQADLRLLGGLLGLLGGALGLLGPLDRLGLGRIGGLGCLLGPAQERFHTTIRPA